MLLDDIVSGIKKQAPRASAPSKPQIETRADADNEQILPDRSDHTKLIKDEATQRLLQGLGNGLQGGVHQEDADKNSDFDQDSDQDDSGQENSDQEDSEHENSGRDDSD